MRFLPPVVVWARWAVSQRRIQSLPTWEVLSTTDLGEEIYATPAISDGRIYLRTAAALYSFGIPE